MALHWPTFFTRLGSAIVFSAIMMAGLLWNEWAFLALVVLIQLLCLRDYFRLMPKVTSGVTQPVWMGWLVQVTGLLLLLAQPFNYEGKAIFPVLLCLPTLLLLGGALANKTALDGAMQAIGGLIYITLPIIAFYHLRLIDFSIPIALILMIWMNDTMAYLVGSFIGRTPFSAISPKKTWEGTAGGAILTVIGAAIWGYFAPKYHMIDWMMLALCAAIAGTAGDLLESKLKRMADVKDSGTLMPGHGGALDRFDSLLVAAPFAFCYAWLIMS